MADYVPVEANARWTMPRKDLVKINVHGSFFHEPLQNGNVSGIGVVVRNSKGKILRMLSGSLGILNRRVNEYYAYLEGCKCAFVEDWKYFYLESDHLDAHWEWRNSTVEGVHPDHQFIVQQLNQRQADRNFHMEVTLCDANANALATYLAEYGARNFKAMVVIAHPFDRVFELWGLDMGLGPVDQQSIAIHEADLDPAVEDGEDAQAPQVEEEGQEDQLVNVEGARVELFEEMA